MRRRVRFLLLAAAAGLIAVALLELGVRLVRAPPVFIGTLPFESELGYESPRALEVQNVDARGPFPFRLNSHGSRGRELPGAGSPRAPGEPRVLFVGDSFLQAWFVREEELMSTECERRLRAAGSPAECFVLACDDYGTAQELVLLERDGERVRPDVIVLTFYAANDVANNTLELAGQVETSAGDYLRPYFVPTPDGGFERTFAQPVRAFLRQLRGFACLDRAMLRRLPRGLREAWAPWPLERAEAEERVKAGLSPVEWYEVYRAHEPGQAWEIGWSVTGRLLGAVAARARELDARLLVLAIPACMQVETNALVYMEEERLRAACGRTFAEMYDLNLPERRLAALCAEEGIELRLLLEPLREAAARTGRTQYSRDGHLIGESHALAAEIIADWILGTERHLSALPGAELSSPVALVPPAERAPSWLDLRQPDAGPMLADGWRMVVDPVSGEPAWAVAQYAFTLLPIGRGARVVVEGELLPETRIPATITLGVKGLKQESAVLEKHGPFDLDLRIRAAETEPSLRPVSISISGVPDQGKRAAIIRGIGVR